MRDEETLLVKLKRATALFGPVETRGAFCVQPRGLKAVKAAKSDSPA